MVTTAECAALFRPTRAQQRIGGAVGMRAEQSAHTNPLGPYLIGLLHPSSCAVRAWRSIIIA
jgi:hypothetical protein